MWDVFISHASEDKDLVVRPLADELTRLGLSVWYDEFTLTIGDSIRRKIEYGLAKSRFGVVVLSHSFFSKEWPQRELDVLFAREISGEKVILPVWHELTRDEVALYSPLLADKIAASTFRGIPAVAREIIDACKLRTNITAYKAIKHISEYIEDLRHNGIWHHYDERDAKSSTWAAIASEAGILNYNYEFIVYFLKLKNANYGWYIKKYIKRYRPVPIPSIAQFLEILSVRRDQLKRVVDSGDLKIEWNWPSSWGKVLWSGPIIHVPLYNKLPDQFYYEFAKNEYEQTIVAIKQYESLFQKERNNN
jgi:hypothetical protein